MNNKKKQNQKTNFIFFPNKLNILTIFLIFVLYGAVLFVVASVVFPKTDYIVTLNYEQSTYNEEINPFALIRGTAEKDDKDPNKLKNSTRIFVYVRPLNNANITRTTYAYSALDSGGIMRYFVESPRTGYNVPVNHNSSKTIVPTNNDLEKLFIKVRYRININDEIETKELKFSEQILHLKERDLKNADYKLGNSLENLLTLNFEVKDNPADLTQYQTNFEIKLNDKTKPHHINFQSWLVTDEGEILPYLGLYNYCDAANFKPSYFTYVNKYTNAEWIYAKLQYTDPTNGTVSELLYKVSIDAIYNKTNE